ncbi:MAG: GC-type dockerin domain-anchored protein [Planctomycetota bacterium]
MDLKMIVVACAVGASSVVFAQSSDADPFADRVVMEADGVPVTFGPFHPNTLWSDPQAVLGQPNVVEIDDSPFNGPARRVTMFWALWFHGSPDPADLGATLTAGASDRPKNGLGLGIGGQVVVEFDDPIENNPDDGGAFHWGVDLIVHGNSFFGNTGGFLGAGDPLGAGVVSGVFAEPMEIAVAQSAAGPWFTPADGVAADALFPSHPWRFDAGANEWTLELNDWTKPVDPSLTIADFNGLSGVQAQDLYDGSAGGAGVDLSRLLDEEGEPATLEWARFVRIRGTSAGEITGFVDVANPATCPADFDGSGVVNISDLFAFIAAFTTDNGNADFDGSGVVNISDLFAFITAFTGSCP